MSNQGQGLLSHFFRICMLCAYTRPRYQVSVFQDHWSSGLSFFSYLKYFSFKALSLKGELIRITCPSNEDPPYTPLLYSKTGVCRGIHFFLFLL